MPERHSTKELFYGYPDWVIAEWCCVSLQTARHWKSGIRAPGPAATKLFMLHRDGRILTSEWEGWRLRNGKLCDPEGHETTQGQLRAYAFIYALAAEFGRQNDAARRELDTIVGQKLRQTRQARAVPAKGQALPPAAPRASNHR